MTGVKVVYRPVHGDDAYVEVLLHGSDQLVGSIRHMPNGTWLATSQGRGKTSKDMKPGFPDRKRAAAWIVSKSGRVPS